MEELICDKGLSAISMAKGRKARGHGHAKEERGPNLTLLGIHSRELIFSGNKINLFLMDYMLKAPPLNSIAFGVDLATHELWVTNLDESVYIILPLSFIKL